MIAASEAAFLATSEPLCGVPWLSPQVDDAALIVKRELLPQAEDAVVLAGDSSCLTGLKAKQLAAELGVPAVNLGTLSSHTTHGFADLVCTTLSQPLKPRLIVFSLLPQSVELNEERTRIFGTYARDLNAYGKNNHHYKISLQERADWLVHKHQFNVFPPEYGGSLTQYRQDLINEAGWYPETGKYRSRDFVRQEFVPTEFSVSGIRTLLDAAAEKRVQIVFFWSPFPTDAVSPEYLAAIQRWTQDLQQQYPSLIVPRLTAPAWSATEFGRVTHLTPKAAEENTRQLAEFLKPRLRR